MAMEWKKDWRYFQKLAEDRSSYRAWKDCKDPEEKAMRQELMRLIFEMEGYDVFVRQTPMPEQHTDLYQYRMSAHTNQRRAISLLLETLFENSLRQGSDENLNLIFSFLDAYIAMLENECRLCKQQNPPGK